MKRELSWFDSKESLKSCWWWAQGKRYFTKRYKVSWKYLVFENRSFRNQKSILFKSFHYYLHIKDKFLLIFAFDLWNVLVTRSYHVLANWLRMFRLLISSDNLNLKKGALSVTLITVLLSKTLAIIIFAAYKTWGTVRKLGVIFGKSSEDYSDSFRFYYPMRR